MTPPGMTDVSCTLSDAALLQRLGTSPGDVIARESSRVQKRWAEMRVAAHEQNQSVRIPILGAWHDRAEREMYGVPPAAQLRAILTLDSRLADMETGAWGARWDAASRAAGDAQAAAIEAAAPAALLARLRAAGTPLALDDTGKRIVAPPRSQLSPQIIAEVIQRKAALLPLLRAEAEAEAEARRPVVIA